MPTRLLIDARKIAARIEAEAHRIDKEHAHRDAIFTEQGDKLRLIREALEITAVQMSGHMGISKTYVRQLERGHRRWDVALTRKYIVALEKLAAAIK